MSSVGNNQNFENEAVQVGSIERAIADLQRNASTDANAIAGGGGLPLYDAVNPNNDFATQQNTITQLLDELETENPDAYGDLIEAMQTSVSTLKQAAGDASSVSSLAQNITSITQYLSQLASALSTKVQIEQLQDQVQTEINNGTSQSTISSDMQNEVNLSAQESSTLNSLRSSTYTDLTTYTNQYNSADVAKSSISGLQKFEDWWTGANPGGTDTQNMNDATDMTQLIDSINQDIVPEEAVIVPNLLQISNMLTGLVEQVDSLMNPNTTAATQQQNLMALNEKLMSIFVMIMGILDLVQEDVSSDKSNNDQIMNQTTTAISEIEISDSQAQQQKYEASVQFNTIMSKVLKAAQIIVTVLGALIVPGVGAMIAGVVIASLEASGVMDKLTAALASKMGQIGADVMVAVLEAVVTMGGSFALDTLLKSAMTEAVATATTSLAKEGVESAVQEAASQLQGVVSENEIRQIVDKFATEAATNAAQKTSTILMKNQNGFALALQWISAMAKNGVGLKAGIEQVVKEKVQQAAQAAADDAARETGKMVKALGAQASLLTRDEFQETMASITDDAANKGAALATSTAVAPKENASWLAKATTRYVKNVTPVGENLGKQTAKLGAAAFTYGVLSNNVLLNLVQYVQNQEHADEASSQNVTLFLEIFQQILASMVQMGGAGTFSGGGTGGFQHAWMQTATATSAISQGGSSLASYGQYEAYNGEGSALSEQEKIQTVTNIILQLIASEITNRTKTETKHDAALAQEHMRNTTSMASHLEDWLQRAGQIGIAG